MGDGNTAEDIAQALRARRAAIQANLQMQYDQGYIDGWDEAAELVAEKFGRDHG